MKLKVYANDPKAFDGHLTDGRELKRHDAEMIDYVAFGHLTDGRELKLRA